MILDKEGRHPVMKRKDKVLMFRLTRREKAAIEKAASAEGFSMSEWVRRLLNAACEGS